MTWSLASYTAQGTEGFGVLREDGTLVAPTELKRWSSTLELLEDWETAQAVLKDLNPAEAPEVQYDALLPPVRWPRKVICAGVNYRKHMREMGGEIPASGWRPFFFLKAPTTSVIGPNDPIVISSPARARYDWEAELAVVIGIKGKNIEAERARVSRRGLLRVQRHHGARVPQARCRAGGRLQLRLVRGQVHGGLAAARAGPDPGLPGA